MGKKQIWWGTAVFLILLLAVVACTSPAGEEVDRGKVEASTGGTVLPPTRGDMVVDLPDMGEAPEFLNDVWLNSDGPVTLASQRGKVVLLEFWTFG